MISLATLGRGYIIASIVFAVIAVVLSIMSPYYTVISDVSCYDRDGNVINGLVCTHTEVVLVYTDWIILFIALFAGLYILGLILVRYDDD